MPQDSFNQCLKDAHETAQEMDSSYGTNTLLLAILQTLRHIEESLENAH